MALVSPSGVRLALIILASVAGTISLLLGARTATAAPSSTSEATVFDCRFNGPGYPALTRTSRPGRLYVVWIRRQLTCDEARSVARRGTGRLNPGFMRSFQLEGGWICTSMAPTVGNGKVLAGQCVKPGSRALVNWLPLCEPTKPCKNLKRES